MLKTTTSNMATIPAIYSEYTLEINYYDPYGEKVGTYFSNPLNEKVFIHNDNLRKLIDSNIPENYQIVPYFAYPKHDITGKNITEEIMIAVKEINPSN